MEHLEDFACDGWRLCDKPDNKAFFWDMFLQFDHLHTLDLHSANDYEVDIAFEARALSQCKGLISVYPVISRSFCVGCFNLQPISPSYTRLWISLFIPFQDIRSLSDAEVKLFARKLSCFPSLTTLYSSDLVSRQQLHFISEAIPQLLSLILACCIPQEESVLDFCTS